MNINRKRRKKEKKRGKTRRGVKKITPIVQMWKLRLNDLSLSNK